MGGCESETISIWGYRVFGVISVKSENHFCLSTASSVRRLPQYGEFSTASSVRRESYGLAVWGGRRRGRRRRLEAQREAESAGGGVVRRQLTGIRLTAVGLVFVK